MTWQLAQLNVAKWRYPVGDPRLADFVDNLDHINHMGDAAPGWVWRFEDESGSAIETRAFEDDPDMLLNLTVWESIEALWDFAFKTEHVEFLRRRGEWFVPHGAEPSTVMWWVPEGHRPSTDEAVERLAHLAEHGPSPYAFSFRDAHDPPAD